MRGNDNNVEDSWWQEGEEPDENGADSSSSGLQESFRSPSNTSSKSHSVSFFNSKSESSEGIVFKGNADESVLQFGDLLDTEVKLWFKMLQKQRSIYYTEDITRWREDMNFISKSRKRCRFYHEIIKFISLSQHVIIWRLDVVDLLIFI